MLGGLLVDTAGWRWIFYLNLPICALALLCARGRLPRVHARPDTTQRLDARGLVLLGPGLAAVIYGLTAAGGPTGCPPRPRPR